MVGLLEMHVGGYQNGVLYSCTPAYSRKLEFAAYPNRVSQWLLAMAYKLRRLYTLFTTKTLRAALTRPDLQIAPSLQWQGAF